MQVRARADKPSHAFAELFDLRENVDNTYEKKKKKKKGSQTLLSAGSNSFSNIIFSTKDYGFYGKQFIILYYLFFYVKHYIEHKEHTVFTVLCNIC